MDYGIQVYGTATDQYGQTETYNSGETIVITDGTPTDPDPVTYTVTFNFNGGTFSDETGVEFTGDQTKIEDVVEGTGVTPPTFASEPEDTGTDPDTVSYTGKYVWSTFDPSDPPAGADPVEYAGTDGVGTPGYYEGDFTNIQEDLEVWAIWEIDDSNGGGR